MIVQIKKLSMPEIGKLTTIALSSNEQLEELPFEGMRDIIKNNIRSDALLDAFTLYIDYVTDSYEDFSFIRHKSVKSNGKPVEFIEDLKPYDLQVYLERAVYSFRRRRDEGVAVFRRYNSAVTEVGGVDDDGTYSTPLSELLVNEFPDKLEIEEWKEKLPYLMLRLHEKGKPYGISTLSCARAMYMSSNTTWKKEYKTQALLAHGIYKMDVNTGECTTKFTGNNGKLQQYFQYWLNGRDGHVDAFYSDLKEFIVICRRLNIDMENLDVANMGESYLRSLFSSYVIPNDLLSSTIQTMRNDRENCRKGAVNIRLMNPNVRSSLSGLQISDFLINYDNDLTVTQEDLAQYLQIQFMQSDMYNNPIHKPSKYLLKIFPDMSIFSDVYLDDGFMYSKSTGRLFLVDLASILGLGVVAEKYMYHESGYFIQLREDYSEIRYLTVVMVSSMIENKDAMLSGVMTLKIDKSRGKQIKWGENMIYSI